VAPQRQARISNYADARFRLIVFPLVWLALGGCDVGEKRGADSGSFRVVNVIPDSPTLSAGLGPDSLGNLSYGESTALTAVARGNYSFTVSYAQPDGTRVKVVDASITIRANEQTSVFLIGPMKSVNMKIVTQADPTPVPGASKSG
jgi:hypothetical protein